MCDYSLLNVRNRTAIAGEPLQVHCFPSGSRGLASPLDLQSDDKSSAPRSWWQKFKSWFSAEPPSEILAVCIPPDTHLILRNFPAPLQKKYGVAEEEEAVFIQLSKEIATYRDAILFQNGKRILIQHLPIGQQVDVLNLGPIAQDAGSILQSLDQIEALNPTPV